MKQILILGAGFGGLETAMLLAKKTPENYEITLVDKSDSFFIGFSKFEIMFGRKPEEAVKYYYRDIKSKRINFYKTEVLNIDVDTKRVSTSVATFEFDYLVVALGADLNKGAIPGFIESGGHEFYSFEGAKQLHNTLLNFRKGEIVLSIFSKPYKCPPAPFEAILMLNDFYKNLGIRDQVHLKMVIPAPKAIPLSSEVSYEIEQLLKQKNIELVKETKITEIDYKNNVAKSEKGDAINYDLFIGVPVHVPPKVVRNSKLGTSGFIKVDPHNLGTSFEGIYAVGDVTSIPVGDVAVPKTGVLAEDGANTVVADILKKEDLGQERPFQAIGSCYPEFGDGNVKKLEANFLGGPKPVVKMNFDETHLQDKIEFESIRIDKWFEIQS